MGNIFCEKSLINNTSSMATFVSNKETYLLIIMQTEHD